MIFTRRVPEQHGTSGGGVVARHAALPLVCVASFLFYNYLGSGAGSNKKAKPLLRLGGEIRTANRPNVAGFELQSIDESNIPDCARDVFVTLHKEAGGEGEHACRGLIIRDDIIVTSKECSTFDFTFDFAGVGIVEAKPHPTLNEGKAMADSFLGFLEAHPPYHFQSIDQSVRRTRLFLSKKINPRVNGTECLAPVLTCGEGGQPIAHNFPLKGEMIPLLELEGIVPDDILWEDKDLQTAKRLGHKLHGKFHSWWTRPITWEEAERAIRDMIEEFTGPPGSLSIPDAHSSFTTRASFLMEAKDPRGHRRERCFYNYFVRYRGWAPFSGLHFFDWLDFGPGRRLLEANMEEKFLKYIQGDKKCVKAMFNRPENKIHYFDEEMRARHEVYLAPSGDGKQLIARYKHDDKLVPPSDESDEGEPHLYAWDLDEKLYLVDNTWDTETYGEPKHSAVMAGRPVLCAGMAHVGENGMVQGIDFKSGHYKPGVGSASILYQWMKERGINMTALHWAGRKTWSMNNCETTDWEGMKIKGYSATALNASCHEMTASPTWIVEVEDDV